MATFGCRIRRHGTPVLQNRGMQNEHDVGPFRDSPAGFKKERRKWSFQTPFLNNSRKRGEERGLSLWDAISVLWKLTQDTSRFLSEILSNIEKNVFGGPTTSFRSGLDLRTAEKYDFSVQILQMPVALAFKFQLSRENRMNSVISRH